MKNMKKKIRDNLGTVAIICFSLSVIIFSINLFGRIGSSILTTIGFMIWAMGFTFFMHDRDKAPKRGFKVVKAEMRKSTHVHYPTRGSVNSAGYDFYADKDYTIAPNEIIKVWTDIKAYMQPDEFLMLDVRSSMSGKFMLANTIGIIDSDYYENPNNDGNIGIFLKNISNEVQHIKRDDKIAQGIFMEYLKIDNDKTTAERKGGFGSSGR